MSMLTAQTEKLRETADEVKRIKDNNVDWLWRDAITLDDAVKEMREAADTIENLRNRLTETCELVNAGDGKCICFECGYKALDEWWNGFKYCPSCGRKVV